MLFLHVIIIIVTISQCFAEYNLTLAGTTQSTYLFKYLQYKDAVILHMNVPTNAKFASFHFRTFEQSTSKFFPDCPVRNITIYLKSNGPPVINPDRSKFSKTFANITRDPIYFLQFSSNNLTDYINITLPQPTTYYAAAFISYTDPKNDKIQQQGLRSECRAFLNADLYVHLPKIISILTSNKSFQINPSEDNEVYKFYVPDNVDHIIVFINILELCSNCSNLSIEIQAENAPNVNTSYKLSNTSVNEEHVFRFWTKEDTWHYIYFDFNRTEVNGTDNAKISVNMKFFSFALQKNIVENTTSSYKYATDKEFRKDLKTTNAYKEYNLIKYGRTESFRYDYDLQPESTSNTFPLYLNISSTFLSILKYEITSSMDIGGTLTFSIAFSPNKLKANGNGTSTNTTLVVCMRKSVKGIPTWPDKCIYHDEISTAPLILNKTISSNAFHIAYPEIGRWYITMKLFCGNCVHCDCSEKCQKIFESCTLECELTCTDDSSCSNCTRICKKEALTDHRCKECNCNGDCKSQSTVCEDNIIFSISSYPCVMGSCSNANIGRCSLVLSEGFAYSTCICRDGYRGWDCTDDSIADTKFIIILGILLLTLSNLFFIPTIYFACKRQYYTEAVVYCFTMFFSTFYHACDADIETGLCIMPIEALQFCDFYCGLFSIWITIIAMSYLPEKISSICHVCGSILLACGTSFDKEALWVFLLPVLSGALILFIAWGLQCKRTRALYPSKHYLKLYLPIGLTIVTLGLIMYAFLQTNNNYKYVHSLWHIAVAISVIFLLPNKNFLP